MKKSPRRTAADWRKIIPRFQSSKLTQAAFCKKEKLSLSAFRFQLYSQPKVKVEPNAKQATSPRFVEAVPSSTIASAADIEVAVGQALIRFSSDTPMSRIAEFVLCVERSRK